MLELIRELVVNYGRAEAKMGAQPNDDTREDAQEKAELKGYLGARIDALQLEIQELRSQLLEDELGHKIDHDYINHLQSQNEERFAFFTWVALYYGCLIIWAITK